MSLLPGRLRASNSGPRSRTHATRASLESLEGRRLLAASAVPQAYGVVGNSTFQVPAPGLLAADVIASGNALTVTASTQPGQGTVSVGADGAFTYLPTASYSGPDSFTYTINDGHGASAVGTVNLSVSATTFEAVVEAGPRLASVNSTQGALLNALLGGATGGGALNLTAVDYNSLANGSINAGSLLNHLQAELGVASPSQALNANATLQQVFLAAASAAQDGGDTADANVLNALAPQVAGITQTVTLADLLQLDTNQGSLAQTKLNALDLVTGTAQLFNSRNVLTTPTPITLSGAQLGLGGVVNSVAISSQVVEPPVIVAGVAGTQFHTSAVRLKLDLALANLTPDTSALNSALTTALGPILGDGVTVQAGASLGHLTVYAEVARANGTIAMVDAATDAVTIQATPGVADVYLGSIPDSVFFNRSRAINPATDLGFGSVGTLSVAATNPLNLPLTSGSAVLQVKGYAQGQAPFNSTLNYTPPYPQTQTATTSATFVTDLANSLANSLQVQLGGSLGTVLDPLVNGTILPALRPEVTQAISPTLSPILGGVADPALNALGTGIGEEIVTVEAAAPFSPPIANPDVAETPEGTPIGVNVLADDSAATGDTLGVQSVTQGDHGGVAIGAGGVVTYTPAVGFTGTDTFGYTLVDPLGNTSSSVVTVTVTPSAAALAPLAKDDLYSTAANVPLTVAAPGVLDNDTDPSGLPLKSSVVATPAHGTVALNPDGSFTYTPAPAFVGTDTFTYQDSDGTGTSNAATVTLRVGLPAAAPPVAADDSYGVTEGSTLTVAAPGILANDTDPGGLALTPTLVRPAAHGTAAPGANGSLTYTPFAGFSGTDTFTYQDTDGTGQSNVATVTIVVAPSSPAPVAQNDPPASLGDAYVTPENTALTIAAPGVLANDSDPSGLPLTPQIASQPAHGTVVLDADGSFVYTPAAGYTGPDSFTYRDSDGAAVGNVATVQVRVTPTDQIPTAANDSYTVAEGAVLTQPAPGVLANDIDPNGLALRPILVAGPAHGTLQFNPDGSFTYTPIAGFSGADSFTYEDSDGHSLSNVATVAFAVTPASAATPPTAVGDSYTTTEGGSLPVANAAGVLANDVDPNGLPITAVLVSQPAHGTVYLNPDGSFTYTPTPGFSGVDTFTYRDSDALATGSPATVSIAVQPTPPAGPMPPPALVGLPSFFSIKRLGFHRQPTELVLSFNQSLDAGRAENLANYGLRTVTKTRRGQKLGAPIRIAGAAYDDAAKTVTLTFPRTLKYRLYYQIHVSGTSPTGLANKAGVMIDGNGDGQAGGDLVLTFGPAILAGPSIPPPVKALSAHQVHTDAVLAAGVNVPKAPHHR